jgi:hypothetical protein
MTDFILPLLNCLVEAFMFLECSGDDEVNPDSAVRCLENMASILSGMDAQNQIELRRQLQKMAQHGRSEAYREFVHSLPDHIGLASV